MTRHDIAGDLERLFVAGVAITTRALEDATPSLELTFPQWRVILVVGDRYEGATISEVANRVGVTLPATSRQLRRLANRGLLQISRDHRDRRAARARLTAEGIEARDAVLAYRRERISEVVAAISVSSAATEEFAAIVDAFDAFR